MVSENHTTLSKTSSTAIALPWLLRLRWGYIISQIVVIYSVSFAFKIRIPVLLVILIFVFEAVSNTILHYLHKSNVPVSDSFVGVIFFLDTVFLTGLLFATGGAMNPFTFLYLVHIVLGAIILPLRWSWGLSLWTIFNYLLLFIPISETLIPLPGADYILTGPICSMITDAAGPLRLHLQGMWVSFAITAFFIVYFVGKIQAALGKHQEMKQALREEKLRNEKLASLASLAAGAAHELSTPLSTIAVATGEMLHALQSSTPDNDIMEDTILIKNQVSTCKEILYEMAAGAGEHRGEEIRTFLINDAGNHVLKSLSLIERKRVSLQIDTEIKKLVIPFRTFCRTTDALIKNGLETSGPESSVQVHWYERNGSLCLAVSDKGDGMDSETVRQATEPFFTTKETGMGLGLFLAKTMAERFGGTLEISSAPGSGTTVILSLKTDKII